MDKSTLGEHLGRAREDAGMTREGLGRTVDLDEVAITALESGERDLDAREIATIAHALDRPLSYFTHAPVAAAVSRRQDSTGLHESTRLLDGELESFASDVQTLLAMGMIGSVDRSAPTGVPRDHADAERMASAYRRRLGLGEDPVENLDEACQRLGLYTFSASLGESGPDGGCVELSSARSSLGAAVINGDVPSGRRRMTLAHELGHWLCGDAYDARYSPEDERMINSFAIHFLAPRVGVNAVWTRNRSRDVRDRSLVVAASFRLSWTAAVGQLRNLGLISSPQHSTLIGERPPRQGDFLRLGLELVEDLKPPSVSMGFATAALNAYVDGRLTPARTIELLRGTLTFDGLPDQRAETRDDLLRSFAGHGD